MSEAGRHLGSPQGGAQRGRQGPRIETEAAPIRYVAELVGADTDSERAIRWLIALTDDQQPPETTFGLVSRVTPVHTAVAQLYGR